MLSHLPVNRRAAVDALGELAKTKVPTFFAGNAFVAARSRRSVKGTYLGDDIVGAATVVENAVQGAA